MKNVADDIRSTIGRTLGRIPSGVFVLTTVHNGRPHAMLASWVQQAAFDPPAISLAIGKDRAIREPLRASKLLALSILPEDDTSLMKRFARGVKPGQDPFQGAAILQSPAGLPVLADALGYLECRVREICDFGADHELFIGEVVAAKMLRDGRAFTHQRGSGFHY
jgi:flavin reductase (DIM6/NTAB) family NADH-FMN oxidoreductase RutF